MADTENSLGGGGGGAIICGLQRPLVACFIYIAKSGGRAPEHPFRFDEVFFCFWGALGGGWWWVFFVCCWVFLVLFFNNLIEGLE